MRHGVVEQMPLLGVLYRILRGQGAAQARNVNLLGGDPGAEDRLDRKSVV